MKKLTLFQIDSTLEERDAVNICNLCKELAGFMDPMDFRNAVEVYNDFCIEGICLDFHCEAALESPDLNDFRAFIIAGKWCKKTLDITEYLSLTFIRQLKMDMIEKYERNLSNNGA